MAVKNQASETVYDQGSVTFENRGIPHGLIPGTRLLQK
jgi:hypothetical protein